MTTFKKPSCFISYCREGADYDSVRYLVQQLNDAAGGEIEFLFDEDLTPGSDLPKFMELVRSVNGIIVLLTPQYKRRVEDREGGVYKEFSQIMARYESELGSANSKVSNTEEYDHLIESPFCFVPIVFSSSFDKSCPKEITDKLSVNFSEYRAHKRKNGNLYITGETRRKYKNKIKKIVAEISAHYIESTEEFRISFEEMLNSFFKTTKHEYIQDDPRLSRLLDNTFVKTHSYKKVSTQTSYLLIGRKGSGKSTITHHLAASSEQKYKKHIEINVNDFELEYLYSFIYGQQNKDEQSITVNQINTFETAWEMFLYVCCIDAVISEYQINNLSQSQRHMIPPLINFLSSIVGANILDTELNHKALYRWCYGKIFDIKDTVIHESRDNMADFSYDITVKLDHEALVQRVFGDEVITAFHKILRSCKRRFLVSMDGFDTAFDEFRTGSRYTGLDSENLSVRVQFELDWLRGFLHIMQKLKSSRNNVPIGTLIDFCTMIPKDRFMEIRSNERDAYIYISKYHDIRWSGIELTIMLRKRLEVIGEYQTNPKDRPNKRLEEVISEKFPCLPPETIITVSGKDYVMPTFIAVLRHTFWRPREILIYFAKMISVVRDFRKRGIEINNFTVSKCISDTTREIIRTEFINEFQRRCANLITILGSFRGAQQTLSKDDLQTILKDIHFEFTDSDELVYDFDKKIEFLYEIGFLGLQASKDLAGRLKLLHSDIFWFSAGDEPLGIIKGESYAQCEFTIHPIFCEYLDLKVENQKLVNNYSWEYLEQQEAHMMI